MIFLWQPQILLIEIVQEKHMIRCFVEPKLSKEAVVAYRRAVDLLPTYGDAHFNLASELEIEGEFHAASEHWRRYLQLDSTGPWADTARERLTHHEMERAVT
jgi:predicted TPR repeat methyltransferase